MKSILSIADEQGRPWLLQEQRQPAGLSNHSDEQPMPKAYWLIRPKDDNQPLRVYQGGDADAVPVPSDILKTASQVFCLTLGPTRETSTSTTEPAAPRCSPAAATVDATAEAPADQIGTTLLWQDENVRIWEFRLPPNVACAFHKHRHPYFFLNLTASLNQELDRNGEDVPNTLPAHQQAGQCTYVSRDKLGQHAVRNVGETLFLQFIVEFQDAEKKDFTAAAIATPTASLPSRTTVNPVLVGLATAGLIISGLLLNFLTAAYPLVLWTLLPSSQQSYQWTVYFPTVVLVQVVHAYLLWTDPKHLAAYRFLTKPIRRAVLPIVMYLVHMDAVKEQEDVAYVQLPATGTTSSTSTQQELFSMLRPSVRRRYKHMQQRFQQHKMRIKSVDAETDLNLQETMPILWSHQKRQSQITNKNVWEEFIKRFLVVSVVPDGVLDLFFNSENALMGFQMGIRQGSVYHWFMYFCRDEGRQSGTWFMGVWMSFLRAMSLQNDGISFVCGLTHHLDSKRNAGFDIASHTDTEVLSTLFPWRSTDRIPSTAIHITTLHDGIGGDANSSGTGKK